MGSSISGLESINQGTSIMEVWDAISCMAQTTLRTNRNAGRGAIPGRGQFCLPRHNVSIAPLAYLRSITFLSRSAQFDVTGPVSADDRAAFLGHDLLDQGKCLYVPSKGIVVKCGARPLLPHLLRARRASSLQYQHIIPYLLREASRVDSFSCVRIPP